MRTEIFIFGVGGLVLLLSIAGYCRDIANELHEQTKLLRRDQGR